MLGFEGLFYLLHDDSPLVKSVTNRWAAVVHDYYSEVLQHEVVGVIFHGDDLGYVTGTMVSPSSLREFLFPHIAECAPLSHKHGKVFWLHFCGIPLEITEDLSGDVKIDAFHSFQNNIIPVTEFKKRYGAQIATLGGVDKGAAYHIEGGIYLSGRHSDTSVDAFRRSCRWSRPKGEEHYTIEQHAIPEGVDSESNLGTDQQANRPIGAFLNCLTLLFAQILKAFSTG